MRRSAAAVAAVLPHKIYDYGYSYGERHQAMHLAVFGRRWRPCLYRPRKVYAIRGDPARVRVSWYGYPNEAPTIELARDVLDA